MVEDDVWTTYLDYFAAFRAQDLDGTARHFRAPLSRVAAGRVQVDATEQAVRDWLRTTWCRLATRNYAGASIESHAVTPIDDGLTMLRVHGIRHDRSGADLERFDVSYTLVRASRSEPWRIVALASAGTAAEQPGSRPVQ